MLPRRPLFVVVHLPSGSLFWVRSLWSIWESNTSRFHLGCWISKWVTGVFLWNGVSSLGSWSLGHIPFVVLICFLVTCHIHMYLHLSVLMIGQLLCNNFVCMAIKIFWLDLTWLCVHSISTFRSTGTVRRENEWSLLWSRHTLHYWLTQAGHNEVCEINTQCTITIRNPWAHFY